MKKIFLAILVMIIASTCSAEVISTPTPEPVVEKVFDQVIDSGKTYSSKDFFDAGFKEYKEYNVSKLTGSTEAWYGFWGHDDDSIRYYELRFYPDHSTAVSEGTSFAENATGDDAKLRRQDTMWRVGLSDRKRSSSALDSHPTQRAQALEVRLAKYADYMIFDNVIILCEGENSKESFKLCNDLINLLKK
jgi:hypothetical protein|tara:strand:- start:396 stop:965 length:570 start_codon:yes stop_codon:yes gene_type:complete